MSETSCLGKNCQGPQLLKSDPFLVDRAQVRKVIISPTLHCPSWDDILMNFLPWSHVKNHKTSRVWWVRREKGERASRQGVLALALPPPSKGLHLVLCPFRGSVSSSCFSVIEASQEGSVWMTGRVFHIASHLSPTQPHSMALSAPEAVSLPPFKELSLLVTRENSCLSVSEQATHCAGLFVFWTSCLIVKDEI